MQNIAAAFTYIIGFYAEYASSLIVHWVHVGAAA